MSLIGKIGKGIKKVAKVGGKVLGGVGDVVSKAAPALGLIPGVGTVAGGIIGGAGGLLGNLNDQDVNFGHVLGNTLKGAGKGAVGGYANTALLGGKGIMGVGSALSGAKSLLDRGASAAGGGVDDLAGEGALTSGHAAGGGGLLDFIKAHAGDILKGGVAVGGALSASHDESEADKHLKAARALLDEPQREDLSYAFGSSNPYRKQRAA